MSLIGPKEFKETHENDFLEQLGHIFKECLLTDKNIVLAKETT